MKDFTKDIEEAPERFEAESIEEALEKLDCFDHSVISGSVRIHEYSLFHFETVSVDDLKETLIEMQKARSGVSFEDTRFV